jgi:hypothetical protein
MDKKRPAATKRHHVMVMKATEPSFEAKPPVNVLGMEPGPCSPPALALTQRNDFVKWERWIQDQKILPQ